jgi:hypothetical protein
LAIVQISQITNRLGLAADLPQLAGAELGWSTDTRQLWIGNGTLAEGAPVIGNTEILTEFSDILNFNTTYTYKGQAAGYTVQTGPTAGDPVTQSLQSWLDQFATVKDFGAVGDGVTDDTDAINRALYQLFCREVNPQIRRSLFFPAGVYRVTGSINIPTYATLYGEGENNSVIQLDSGTSATCVAQTADSLQQTGVNIGNNGATPPQYITVSNMGFKSLGNTDIVQVQETTNSRFQNVGFYGPLTTTDLTTDAANISGVSFVSGTTLICDQIVFDGCQYTGTTWGVYTNQQTKGIVFSNSKFNLLYCGIELGTGTLINGGPTGVRVAQNIFDNIYTEGVIFGNITLNATGYNIFYNVGNNNFSNDLTTPWTACIDIQSSNNISVGDVFARPDAYSGIINPGISYPRITLNNSTSIATTNGSQTAQGTLVTQSGIIATLTDNTSSATAFIQESTTTAKAFTVTYTITRDSAYRSGTSDNPLALSPSPTTSDAYVENTPVGVVLSASQTGTTVSINYTSTSTGSNASISYSITYLS